MSYSSLSGGGIKAMTFLDKEMSYENSIITVERALVYLSGVSDFENYPEKGWLKVSYYPEKTVLTDIEQVAINSGLRGCR